MDKNSISFPLWMDVLIYIDDEARKKSDSQSVSSIYKKSGYMATYSWMINIVKELGARNIVQSEMVGRSRMVNLTVKGMQAAKHARAIRKALGEVVVQ